MNSFIEKMLQPRRLVPLLTVLGALYRMFVMPLDLTVGDDIDDYITLATLLSNAWNWTAVGNIPADLGAFGYLPGYPLFLALLYPLTQDHWVSARLVTLTCGVAGIPLTYIAFKHFFGEKISLISAAAVAVSSTMVAQSSRSATEMPFIAIFLLALWVSMKALSQRRASLLVLVGALSSLMLVTRPEGVLFVLALFLFLWRNDTSKKHWACILGSSLTVTGLLVALSPVSGEILRHYTVYVRHESPGLIQMGMNVLVNGVFLLKGLLQSLGGFMLLSVLGLRTLSHERRGTAMLWWLSLGLPTLLYLFYPTYLHASHEELPRYATLLIPMLAALGARGFLECLPNLGHRLQYGLAAAMMLSTLNVAHTKERSLYWADHLMVGNRALRFLETSVPENFLIHSPGSAQRNWAVTMGRFRFSESEPAGEHYLLVTEPSQPYSSSAKNPVLLAEFRGTEDWSSKVYAVNMLEKQGKPEKVVLKRSRLLCDLIKEKAGSLVER